MISKNNILLVSPAYPPPFIGGSSVYMYTLIENSQYNFDILTSKLPSQEKEVISSRHNVYRKSPIFFSPEPSRTSLIISYLYHLIWIIKYKIKKQPPLVIVNGEVILNSLIIILGKILKFKVIPISYAEEITVPLKGKGFKSYIKLFILKFAYPKAYRHISCCHFARELLNSEINVEVNKIDVIPIAFSNKKVVQNNKRKNNYTQNILSVGRLVPRKGFVELINVVKRLRKDMPLIKLNIVGQGPLEEQIKKIVKEEKLEDFIFIHGKVSDKKLHNLYLNSDIFVLAHRMLKNGDTEGSPITFAEAGLYNLPSIGGINSGSSTIINHNETGLIIDMKDDNKLISSIKNLFSDKQLIIKMGESARKKIISEHSPEEIGNKFSEFINNNIL